jgi:hypothetical protein
MKMILPKNINKIGVDCICRISFVVILHLVFFSCTSNQTAEKTLFVDDIDLKLAHEQRIDMKLASLGIIDITDLTSKNALDNLNLKVARSSTNIDEMFSIVLLDKNGNGLHSDLNVDLIALAPNQWAVLDGSRFSYLNFVPFKVRVPHTPPRGLVTPVLWEVCIRFSFTQFSGCCRIKSIALAYV